MSAFGETPPPAPTSLACQDAPEKASGAGSEFVVLTNVVGVTLRCVVDPNWRCEALLGAAAEAYHTSFPDSEVPECNVIFHRKKQQFLVAGMAIGECCVSGDELELGVTLPAPADAHSEATPSIVPSSVSGRDSDGEMSEFCVLFHKLPLGFTMKRGHGSSTEVGTIYPRSAATHFPRLAPGVTIMSIAGSSLKDMGLRQVHELIKNAALPLEIHFRGPELLASPTLAPDAAEQGAQSSNTSGRGGGNRSPRATALRNLNKRYNYMPQKYAANAAGASDTATTSLSSRGAVMSRARFSRDSFITKSESPGVGYYDVKVKDRVKGGEIGDSDRSLPWS
ncbi:hypothetical protein JM18_001971 [Phytophthora kernoviae]|uniref:PDZ domain-containing protein n=2 Tax=Phytophthora kernoviae TaxID=325452 RepID=A0A3F2RXK9_9STRA|nr:hypothetical protein G195_004629 [Phytophthora kernoviae 00238/432]KAG2526742.1 hypothetical protein JM16_003716 [Phytophthora kernoviae]KAG2530711.1 hypothetical protein JM18_001971 [Phytophthora kernoviae]RLN66233.1 hypothetical protein BBP00_00002340 [Phytophthora kernoviae]RLN71385.1 hypothetical protein BBJ29_006429 [Phytophthora kernoviae]